MIDFIKIEIVDHALVENIRNNTLLEFEKEIIKSNKSTGEMFYMVRFNYKKTLTFIFIENNDRIVKKLLISGSLHYLFNNGSHNANDFSFRQCTFVIKELQLLFAIDPVKCKLRSLEFGVNIKPGPYISRQILQNTFYHGQKKFLEPIDKPYKQSGDLRSNDYILKFYDKAYQFPIFAEGEILRFEIKFGRMRSLNKIDINFLYDLTIQENHFKLCKILWERFNEILMFDHSIRENELSTQNRNSCLKYQNPNYWEALILDIKKNQNKRNLFYYHKKMLHKITSNHSDDVQGLLFHIMQQKCIELLHLSSFNGPEKNSCKTTVISDGNINCLAPAPLFIG